MAMVLGGVVRNVLIVVAIMLAVLSCGCEEDDDGPPPVDEPPVARLAGPATGWVGDPLAFDASNSTDDGPGSLIYTWEWGDGNTDGTGPIALHTYSTAGVFRVNVTVSDVMGQSDTTSADVTVRWRIVINIQSPHVQAQSGAPGRYEVLLNFNKVTPSEADVPWSDLRLAAVGTGGAPLQALTALRPDGSVYADPPVPEFWYVDIRGDGSVGSGDAVKVTGVDATWEGAEVLLQVGGETVGQATVPADFP